MGRKVKKTAPPSGTASSMDKFEIELHRVPIIWDLPEGNVTFFGLDAALFWTDPSLVRIFSPIVEEIGVDLFQLLVAHSSSLGTDEDYHVMVSTLGRNFAEGFLAWGKAVSGAGWGAFEMPAYDPDAKKARVVVKNPWELNMQKNIPRQKQWGCPFLKGKLIGIFSHAFGTRCWAEEDCFYDPDLPRVEFEIFASSKTISREMKKLRHQQMMARERKLAEEIDHKTVALSTARKQLEEYSKTLEQKVTHRTRELESLLKLLEGEKEKLKVMAETDALTGLYNRRAFFELGAQLIEQYFRRDQVVTVIMIDIDHFKQINDTNGHAAGDQVLVELSGLMKKMFRSMDVIGRVGGEEFAIICVNADFVANPIPLERFRLAIEEYPVRFNRKEIRFTISIGATLGEKGDGIEELFLKADHLLYEAKKLGRNRVVSARFVH